MAQMMTINLTKGESPNLGFRLQGGVDFAAPLVIQKVNGGSPADRAGLQAGDAVIKINSTDVFNLRHKDAQDVIIKAGSSFTVTVQRGGSTWKPSVVPTGSLSQGAISPVTKTSLAAKPQSSIGAIGTGHNVAAKPFLNGTANGGPKLVNKQYNSPIGLYSDRSIAETLSAQSEVLSTGVLGVNFKKNEKNYDATKSAVYHMLQEAENDPRSEPDQVDSGLSPPISNFGLKHVQAPENKPAAPTPQLPPGQNICADCERLIVGVFVRIKDKNLHVECFKCSTCGASLKNVGYYNINNKLYCDVHAKLAAKANPPGPNLVPVTLPPGGRAPAGTISAALSTHPLPTQAPLSPKFGPASPSANITAAPFLPDNRLPRKAPPDDLDVNSNHKEDFDSIDARLLKSLTIAASRKGNANTNKIANITSIGRKSSDYYNEEIVDETVKGDADIYEANAVATKQYDDFAARKAITAASRKSDANIDDNKLTSVNNNNNNTLAAWNNEANIDEFVAHEANLTKYSPYRPLPIPYSQFSTRVNKAGYTNAPRPFSSVVAPLSPNSYSKPLPRTPVAPPPSIPTPTSAPVSAPGLFTAKPAGGMPKDQGRLVYNIVWPPVNEESELPTASPLYFPPPSQVKISRSENSFCESTSQQVSCTNSTSEQRVCCYKTNQKDFEEQRKSCNTSVCEQFERDYSELEDYTNIIAAMEHQKMSVCSSEVCNLTGRKSAMECAESLAETLQTQMLVDSIIKKRPKSPPPLNVDVVLKAEKRPSLAHQEMDGKEVRSVCPNLCNKSCCNQNCPTCPLKNPADLKYPHDYQKAEELKGKVQNAVPHKYETPMVNALKTTPSNPVCISPDIFTYIPSKHSTSALASALSIAPREPFNPVQSVAKSMEPVPLPEITAPYFPPERPIIPVEPKPVKKEIAKPDSPFVEALKVAPERPYSPIGKGPTPIRKKPPPDPLLKDLPKPQQKMTMLEALTTSSDRAYSPLIPDIVAPVKTEEAKPKVEPKKVIRPPQPQPFISTMVNTFEGSGEQNPASSFPPVSIELQQGDKQVQMMHEQGLRHQEVMRQEIELRQQQINQMQQKQDHQMQEMYHMQKQEMYQMEHMQKQEMYQQKQEMYQKQDMRRERYEREAFQQKQEMHQKSDKHVMIAEKQQIAKQSEEVIMKKPMPLTSTLHKSEYIPQYQTSLQYDEEIQLPHHKNINKLLQPKKSKIVPEPGPLLRPQPHHDTVTPPPQITKPVQIVQSGNPTFQPVHDDFRPPSSSMPQRLGNPATPSMINKPPSAIPYYQQNLVATQYLAPDINVFDPKSPATSRSPSPCPGGRERSPSPFRPAPRARSPAPGPPPNPLKKEPKQGPQFQHEFQKEKAKDNVASYIPQHREHFHGILKKEGDHYDDLQQTQVLAQTESRSQIAGQNYQQQNYEASRFRAQDSQKHHTSQVGNMSVSVSEQEKLAQLQKLNKSQTESVETSPDSRIQVQRKRTVTEEFERTHKEKTIEIEKTSQHPFQKVNVPKIEEQGIVGLHVTNPHALNSPFLRNQPQHPPPPPVPEQKIEKRTIPDCRSQAQAPQVPPPHPPSKFSVPVPPISAPSSAQNVKPSVPAPSVGTGSGRQASSVFAPKRGRGVLNVGGMAGNRIALCGSCHQQIRGPFITALGKIWCPDHFVCATPSCKRPLQDIGFVEEQGQLHCEYCFERYLAPDCSKCNSKIKGDCLKAIGKNFHPECFNCSYCGKLFGNSPFFLEDGLPYCEVDWNEMFTTKCFACGFPVEAGDRWVEALNNNYHTQCFNCTMCKKNLEGQSFFAKGGRPFCKNHAR